MAKTFSSLVVLALALLGTCFGSSRYGKYEGRITDAPVENGFCDPDVAELSGYYDVSDLEGGRSKSYFYWFFESRSDPSTDPFIIWLTGGPGCSSMLALLSENGPCAVNDDLTTSVNEYSWNNQANIMWIDQPAGVGFSYGDMSDGTQAEVSEDLYYFLQEFFTAHTDYLSRPFYVFGESYGGHYVPSIAYRIMQGNTNGDGLEINLTGVGIGNGLTDPLIQYQYYAEMANNNTYGIKAVSDKSYESMVEHTPSCTNLISKCQTTTSACATADTYCNLYLTTPYYNTGLNPYDIRKECGDYDLCYDFSNVEGFLQLDSTLEALHVSSESRTWTECNNYVNSQFTSDWMKDYQDDLVALLEENKRVLIYAGDADFICNWMGNKAWTLALEWTGDEDFNAASDDEWYLSDGTAAGVVRSTDGFTFLRVYGAGHMVPMDQPKAAAEMLTTFLNNEEFQI